MIPTTGAVELRADVVADGQAADGPGDHQEEPEHLHENHALASLSAHPPSHLATPGSALCTDMGVIGASRRGA